MLLVFPSRAGVEAVSRARLGREIERKPGIELLI